MANPDPRQIALKPQDLLVLFALLGYDSGSASYPELAARTGLAVSAVHGAVKRAVAAGLATYRNRRPIVLKPPLREFVRSGARYAFPAVHGRLTRGVPTAHAAAPLNAVMVPSADPPPVWADKNGTVRCVASRWPRCIPPCRRPHEGTVNCTNCLPCSMQCAPARHASGKLRRSNWQSAFEPPGPQPGADRPILFCVALGLALSVRLPMTAGTVARIVLCTAVGTEVSFGIEILQFAAIARTSSAGDVL